MADMSVMLPVTAAIIHIVAYVLYNVQTKLGKSDPNPVSWFLWAFLATLNALSFSAMNDRIAALQFFAGSVGSTATFLYVLFIGRFRWLNTREWVVLVFGIIAIFVWRQYTATTANMILAGVLLWSFEPTIRGVWNNPLKEKSTTWWLWTMAFAITGANTYLYKGGWTLSLVISFVGILGHGVVAVLCRDSRKKSFFH